MKVIYSDLDLCYFNLLNLTFHICYIKKNDLIRRERITFEIVVPDKCIK